MVPHERQGKARWSQSFMIACYILVTDVNEIKWGSRFSSKFDINVLYYRVGVKINRVLRTPHLNANWSFYPWYISACRVCGFSSCASSLGHMTSVCLLYLLCEELNFFKPLEVSLLQHDSLSVWDDGASWSILYRRGGILWAVALAYGWSCDLKWICVLCRDGAKMFWRYTSKLQKSMNASSYLSVSVFVMSCSVIYNFMKYI